MQKKPPKSTATKDTPMTNTWPFKKVTQTLEAWNDRLNKSADMKGQLVTCYDKNVAAF